MKRVPADLVLFALRQEGIHIKPASLRNWTRRGRISRTAEGYDLAEIAAYVKARTSTNTPSRDECLTAGHTR